MLRDGGAMYCSKCGANVPDGAVFCAACGQPVPGNSAVQPDPRVSSAPVVDSAVAPVYTAPVPQTSQMPAAQSSIGYAGFWLRFVAVIIDGILLYFVRKILFMPFGLGMGMRGMFHGRPPQNINDFIPYIGLFIRVAIVSSIIQWLYFSIMESSSWQATLGKKALGLTVTDLEGRRISFGRATGRYFAKIISTLILFIGYIMAGFTEKKQALHDIIAGTLVLRKL
jgi:uncharacterized RDD family membrane protein YckC